MAPFGQELEGKAGTIVFGRGVHAVQVKEILHADGQTVVAKLQKGRYDLEEPTIAVPVSSIVFFRYKTAVK